MERLINEEDYIDSGIYNTLLNTLKMLEAKDGDYKIISKYRLDFDRKVNKLKVEIFGTVFSNPVNFVINLDNQKCGSEFSLDALEKSRLWIQEDEEIYEHIEALRKLFKEGTYERSL